jgi:hypothetical protein
MILSWGVADGAVVDSYQAGAHQPSRVGRAPNSPDSRELRRHRSVFHKSSADGPLGMEKGKPFTMAGFIGIRAMRPAF